MAPAQIRIRAYQPQDRDAFRILNEEWISHYFTIEPQDQLMLGDPERFILQPGGYIYMAFSGDDTVGCCALIPEHEPHTYELGKMSVAPEWRGRGIGRLILEHTIREARRIGASRLYLGSNTVLANAIHLYESCGFVRLPAERIPQSPYQRANVFMELRFTPEES